MLFEKLAKKSPEALILNTWESLRTTYNLIPESTCFDGFTQGLRDSIKKGNISEAVLDDQWLAHIATDQMNPTCPFIHACLLNEVAQQTLDSGDLNKSWPLIVQASTKAEVAAVHIFYNTKIDIPAALNHRRASTAANASNSKLQPVKDYALTLMRKKKPTHGWLDLKHAAQSIESELGDFVERERISLSRALLVNTLKRWHKTDERFRDLVNEIIG